MGVYRDLRRRAGHAVPRGVPAPAADGRRADSGPLEAEDVVDQNSRRGREDDQQDGVDLAPRPCEDSAEQHPAPGVDEILVAGGVAVGEDQQQGRRRDHADHRRAHAPHGSLDQPVVFEAHEEARHEDHQRERRQADGEGGDHRTEDAAPEVSGLDSDAVTHVGRRVDGDGAGGDLRHGDDVGELGVGHPLVLHDHLVLDQRQHGVAPAESEEAYLKV